MTARRNGKAKAKRPAKLKVRGRATKAQLAARGRLLRALERETGVKITRAEIDAVAAELDPIVFG
jgi:hypothetical protein